MLSQPLPEGWKIAAYFRADLDITDALAVRDAVRELNPELIINLAAMTAVDQAERDANSAMAANFHSVANLAAQAVAQDIPVIHLSTDYVFDGRTNTPYRPDDAMNPVNVYGRSKMLGEEALRQELPWHVILRVSSVFSEFGENILTKTLKLLDERDELRFVTDQLGCPTYAPDIAAAVVKIADEILRGKIDGFGTFHLCGSPPVTRFELTNEIMAAYAPYTDRRPKILPTLSTIFADLAPRPAYSVLDCAKIRDVYGIEQRPWREGLNAAILRLMRDKGHVV